MSSFFDEKFVNSTIEGVVAQVFTDFFLAPAHRIMVLQQAQPKVYKARPSDPPIYRGSLHYTLQIVKHEGFFGLWKGNLVGTMKNAMHRLATCIFARLYEPIFLKEDAGSSSVAATSFREFMLLTAVEFTTLLIQHPFKVVQVKMATEIQEHQAAERPTGLKAIWHCVKRIWEEEGLIGFYKGLSVAALQSLARVALLTVERNVISSYAAESQQKQKHRHRRLVKELVYSGGLSNMFFTYLRNLSVVRNAAKNTEKIIFHTLYKLGSALILYPFHVVQTRMIAHEQGVRLVRPTEVALEILENEGFRGFYNGLLITTIHTGGSFIMLPIFRAFMKGFIKGKEQRADEKKSLGEKGAKYLKKKKDKLKKFTRDAKEKVREKVSENVKKHERDHLSSERFSD